MVTSYNVCMSLLSAGLSFVSSLAEDGTRMSRAQKIHRENERSNLLTITRLVLRSFLEESLTSNHRILEGDTQKTADLLMMLEKVLWHGFKTSAQKTILALRTPDGDLWAAIGKISKEDEAMYESYRCVENIDNLSTSIAKVRAFIRLAIMQKKLFEFFTLITHSPTLQEVYEPWALLRQEDAVQLTGALLGLSAVDCNLLLDNDHLQEQPLSVDLSQYIRIPTVATNDEGKEVSECEVAQEKERKMLSDQNCYLEERNRLLQSKVDELKKKLADKEERTSLTTPVQEMSLKRLSAEEDKSADSNGSSMEEFSKKEALWATERQHFEESIAELHDNLRITQQQFMDMKKVSADLYDKLRDAERIENVHQKTILELRQTSEKQTETHQRHMANLQKTLDGLTSRDQDRQTELASVKTAHAELQHMSDQYCEAIADLEKKQNELRDVTEQLQKLKIENDRLTSELKEAPFLQKELYELQEKYDVTHRRCNEYEKALEELGGHLSESKLQMVELKEELLPFSDAHWEKDSSVKECHGCENQFSVSRRRHHCRMCGSIFCAACSASRVKLPSNAKPVRVCENCFQVINNRVSAANSS